MLENIWFIAAVWMGLALIVSLISIRTGISVALVEILVGVMAGNLAIGLEGGTLHVGIAGAGASMDTCINVLQSTEWTNFLALLGSGVLTFLAGAEIDPVSLKTNWRASVLIWLNSRPSHEKICIHQLAATNGEDARPIGNCALFTLEVRSDGRRIRDANDYIPKRSAEERSSCHGRELL